MKVERLGRADSFELLYVLYTGPAIMVGYVTRYHHVQMYMYMAYLALLGSCAF